MYEVSGIVKFWALSDGDYSHPSIGNYKAGLDVEKGVLKIYLTEQSITSKFPPYELVELFSMFCGIKDPIHLTLLSSVLTQMEFEDIRDMFRNQGILDLSDGEADLYSEDEGNDSLEAVPISCFIRKVINYWKIGIPPTAQPPTRYVAGSGNLQIVLKSSAMAPTNMSPFTDFKVRLEYWKASATEKLRQERAILRPKRSRLGLKYGESKDDSLLFLGELIVRQERTPIHNFKR